MTIAVVNINKTKTDNRLRGSNSMNREDKRKRLLNKTFVLK